MIELMTMVAIWCGNLYGEFDVIPRTSVLACRERLYNCVMGVKSPIKYHPENRKLVMYCIHEEFKWVEL